MNGKKAKALRRIAEAMTVGMPERDPAPGYLYRHERDNITGKHYKVGHWTPWAHGKETTRSVYQRLKRS